jgi:integrase
MSVRRRQWYTRKQIQAWAVKLAGNQGLPDDQWPAYIDAARRDLNNRLRRAKNKEAEAVAAVKKFPPQEAWLVDYTDQHGDRCFETFEKKKDADDYHATVKVDVRKGVHVAPNKSPTMKDAAESWIKKVEADDNEPTTVRQYRQHINLHILPRFDRTLRLAELNPARVEAFRDSLLAELSLPLAKKVLTSFKSLLRVAKHAHVADGVSIKSNKRKKRVLEAGRDIPEPGEIKRLIDATTDLRLRALLLTAALTGLRASELRGLRWKDIDFEREELHVRQRADRYCKIGPPKSEASARTVPLDSEKLIPALKTWKFKSGRSKEELVFPTSTGHVEHHSNMLRSLAPIMIAAGVVKNDKPKYALHAFRHFFASWCINPIERLGRGFSPKVVQVLLGHSSIVMTQDIYGHLFPRSGDDRAELAASTRTLFA